MYLPIILGGCLLGFRYGLVLGVISPLISFWFTSIFQNPMPALNRLPFMMIGTTLNSIIDEINKSQNKKILSLESPIEYKHTSKKSIIVQKEIGPGKDCLTYSEGVENALREDCDILVIRRNS